MVFWRTSGIIFSSSLLISGQQPFVRTNALKSILDTFAIIGFVSWTNYSAIMTSFYIVTILEIATDPTSVFNLAINNFSDSVFFEEELRSLLHKNF